MTAAAPVTGAGTDRLKARKLGRTAEVPGPIYGRLPSSCQSLLLLTIFWAFFFGVIDFVGGSKNFFFLQLNQLSGRRQRVKGVFDPASRASQET